MQFIKVYKEVHGMPQPEAPRGRLAGLIHLQHIYLHHKISKTVDSQYVCACKSTGSTHVGYSVFKPVWQCMPHVRFMTPRTDACAVCEDMRQNVQSALTEEEKVSAMAKFQQHIENAQDERQFYKSATVAAKEEYDVFRRDGRISDCSYIWPMGSVFYHALYPCQSVTTLQYCIKILSHLSTL